MDSTRAKQPAILVRSAVVGAFFAALAAALLGGTAPARAEDATKPAAPAAASTAPAAPVPTVPTQRGRKVQVYKLETVEIQGSTRLAARDLASELGLVMGTPLDDELVMSTRTRLLGLGLFKSAILVMRKGTQPGFAKLIIELEDDDSVLTDWALGGELGVSLSENAAKTVDPDRAPLDYRLGLVGRNLFNNMHRGSLYFEFDSSGHFQGGQLAYGFPRFTREDVQFDAEIAGTNVHHRYLDVLGFGGRGQGLWSRTVGGLGEVQYGAAMYVNKGPEFALNGFPSAVAGPKFAYFKETRLRGFFPGRGHLIGASVLVSPTETEKSVLEVNLAKTFSFADMLYFTLDTRVLTVGVDGYSLRGESRFDIPLGHQDPGEDQAEVFLRLRGGHDVLEETNLVGSAAIIGVRYHSSGFIAELAIKVTRSPEDLNPAKGLKGAREGQQ